MAQARAVPSIPKSFCTPEGGEIFQDPVVWSVDGKSYERKAIEKEIGAPLDEKEYYPHLALKSIIDAYSLLMKNEISFEEFRGEVDKKISVESNELGIFAVPKGYMNHPVICPNGLSYEAGSPFIYQKEVVPNNTLAQFIDNDLEKLMEECRVFANERIAAEHPGPGWSGGQFGPFP